MSQPPAIMSIAAPKDAMFLAKWEDHLLLLQRAGHLSFWSFAHLIPGTRRDQEITRQLERATLIVLLLSSDFFANDECYELMQRALQRDKEGQATVIPMLLRSVGWRDTPLGGLHCVASNGRPIAQWPRSDDAYQDCIDELKKLLSQPGHTAPNNARLLRKGHVLSVFHLSTYFSYEAS